MGVEILKVGIDSRAAIWYRGTGMGTYTYQLIRNICLIDKKADYHFFLPNERFQGVNPLNSGVFHSIGQTKDKFWEEIAAFSIDPQGMDVYHVPQNGIGLPKEKRCKTVVTIHDLIPYILPETVGPGYLKIFRETMPSIVEKADHIVTVSRHSKDDLVRLMQVPEEKISVIYEAAEAIYKPVNKDLAKARLANKYGILEPYILYLGGFSPRKNLVGLINAFAVLKKELKSPCKLLVVGRQNPLVVKAKKAAAKTPFSDDIVFAGFAPVQDLPFLYNGAELFAYPSFYEGFGLPPIEAMACGTPTIVSNVSSLPEVVGDAALSVNPEDCFALADSMYRILNDQALQQTLSKAGIMRAAGFSWTKTAAQTIKVYKNLI